MPTLRSGKVWHVNQNFGVCFLQFRYLKNSYLLFQISSPHGKYCNPILPHVNMDTPTMFQVDKKTRAHKKVYHKNVLIPWYPISYLTIASSGFFGGGRLRVPTRRCDLVVPADGGWGSSI
jgi:hypothetical protein